MKAAKMWEVRCAIRKGEERKEFTFRVICSEDKAETEVVGLVEAELALQYSAAIVLACFIRDFTCEHVHYVFT